MEAPFCEGTPTNGERSIQVYAPPESGVKKFAPRRARILNLWSGGLAVIPEKNGVGRAIGAVGPTREV